MATERKDDKQDGITALRARLGEAQKKAERATKEEQRVVEAVAVQSALARLPHDYRRVIVALDQAGLLDRVEIDYVDEFMRRIDFALLDKRIAIRLTVPPAVAWSRRIPDFLYTDAALREDRWVTLYVDPFSHSAKAQLEQVVSVIKAVYTAPGAEK